MRDEISKIIQSNKRLDSSSLEWAETLADKIFKYFESRTCNNCKSRNCDIKRDLLEIGSINPDYFSCNDWEQK